jgi:phage/plasmid-associated DNA primase
LPVAAGCNSVRGAQNAIDKKHITAAQELADYFNWAVFPVNTSIDLVSNIINIDYTRDAKAPIFETFVQQILNDNAELVCWVQRALGLELVQVLTFTA